MIELRNLSYGYVKNELVINNLDVVFKEGIYFINGVNGSGKTTLLNLISGVLVPDSGVVLVDGNKIDMFSNVAALDYHNIDFFDSLTVSGLIDILSDVFIDSKVLSLKIVGLFKINIDTKISNLSMGNKRKLMLLPILLTDKKIILLDEPFDNLDHDSIELIFTQLKQISFDRTIIIVSHINNALFNDNLHFQLVEGKLC